MGGRKLIYVNAYSVSRHYGGPEEGGWWYDVGEPLASVPILNPANRDCTLCGCNHDQAHPDDIDSECAQAIADYAEYDKLVAAERARLTDLIGWPKERSIGRFSVLGGDDFEIIVEDEPAKAYPAERPHYE